MGSLAKSLGIGIGAAALGSFLFPETASYITGGLVGSSGASSTADALSKSSSIWSDPTVLSSGILAGTSLLSGLFGSSSQDELNQAQLAEEKRQFDLTMALKQADLQQALEIAKLQAGASRGGGDTGRSASIAANAALKQARANLIAKGAEQKAQAMQLPLAARNNQSNAAQTTGTQSGMFFNNLIANLQRPALGVS